MATTATISLHDTHPDSPITLQPDWYAVQYCATKAQVDDKTIRRAIARGELVARRFGTKALRVSRESFEAWGTPVGNAR